MKKALITYRKTVREGEAQDEPQKPRKLYRQYYSRTNVETVAISQTAAHINFTVDESPVEDFLTSRDVKFSLVPGPSGSLIITENEKHKVTISSGDYICVDNDNRIQVVSALTWSRIQAKTA
mgnify:CR=1 FL=1